MKCYMIVSANFPHFVCCLAFFIYVCLCFSRRAVILVFCPILTPQKGRRIRYTWCSIPFCVLSHFGPPKRQAYLFYPILTPQNGRCIRYTWCSIPFWAPKWQSYQIHLVFYPILGPQNGRRIRYTWCSIPCWPPKMAVVPDTPGVLSHLGPPKWQAYQIHLGSIPSGPPKMTGRFGPQKWQAYQIHLVFHPILAPQNDRRIRYTWCSIPFWPPKMAGVSDTPGVLSHLGPPKMAVVSHTPGANVGGRNVGNHMLIFF